ncbi:MAG: tetratricopeptide repeat protein, partial [Anaerolineales bacterium]
MTGRREEFDQAMRLGHSAAWDQHWDRAISAYRAALVEFPDDAIALTSLAFVLLQADKLDESLKAYQRAATLNPGDPVAPEKCGEIFERQGRLNDAAQTFLAVAEVHLRRRDVNKAIDNWSRVVRLTPDNLAAHSRLALACERIGQTHPAVLEYIEIARIFQRARDTEKAAAAINRALTLEPQSNEAREALDKLRRGVPLPLTPRAVVIDSAPFDKSLLDFGDDAPAAQPAGAGGPPSPLADLLEPALGQLAELLFEEDAELAKRSGSVDALTRGTGQLRGDQARRAQSVKHLGQAISLYTTGDLPGAVKQYENALKAGLESPVVSFVLGALHLSEHRPAEAAPLFKAALLHEVFGVGALYGLGVAEKEQGQLREAVTHLLGVLKRLDQQLVTSDRQDSLSEAYEGLAEGLQQATPEELAPIASNIVEFLSGEGWPQRLAQAREQL